MYHLEALLEVQKRLKVPPQGNRKRYENFDEYKNFKIFNFQHLILNFSY